MPVFTLSQRELQDVKFPSSSLNSPWLWFMFAQSLLQKERMWGTWYPTTRWLSVSESLPMLLLNCYSTCKLMDLSIKGAIKPKTLKPVHSSIFLNLHYHLWSFLVFFKKLRCFHFSLLNRKSVLMLILNPLHCFSWKKSNILYVLLEFSTHLRLKYLLG